MKSVIAILGLVLLSGCASDGSARWLAGTNAGGCGKPTSDQELALNMAQDMADEGRLHASLAHLESLPPDLADVRLRKARVLRLLGSNEAEPLYKSLLGTCRAAEGEHGLGQLAAARGDNGQALMHLQAAVKLSPTDEKIRNDLGVVYLNQLKLEQARFQFLTAIELKQSDSLAALNLVTLLIYRLAARDGYTDVATMLLAGVAINAIAGAVIGLMVFISNDQQLRDLNFWMLGSLGGVTWKHMLPALPFIVVPAIGLLAMGRQLNAMLLGEREAYHLGFDVERAKMLIIVGVALVTGAAVSITGVIGFVGLVVPHLVRLAIGPDHRILMPASIFLGSALLLIADLGARTLALPAELPIGILTSCIGGPFFIWLLTRRRGRGIF